MAELKNLQKLIKVSFTKPELLEVALTHRSFLNENRDSKQPHNERLEFLGDAVLGLVVTEYLYQNYSEPEGVLTNWRSALVKTESLSATAQELSLQDYIRLSRGEAKGSERARQQIMANATEALIGAIYLDKGYNGARDFIVGRIVKNLPEILKSGTWQDAKTKYQELIQEQEGFTPEYRVTAESGPDHDKQFKIGVYVGGELRGEGGGSSKQAAQQAAAAQALSRNLEKSG